MEVLLSTKFIDIEFDNETKIFKLLWKPETENMTDDEFKEIMLKFVDEFHRKPTGGIHQMQEMGFTISPELQEWVDENVSKPAWEAGAKKIAFVLSSNIFASVSAEQTAEQEITSKMEVQYFDNEDEAMKWLLK